MGERTTYAPGTFCWTDLTTTDQEGAKAFYAALFGWTADDQPVGDGVTYSMQLLGERHVCAISPQPEAQREAGVPPVWNSYISVQSADDAAQRAAELGADVHAPPFDVMDAGRMAVVQDPQGAWFMLWQPKDHHGAGLVNAPGALTWNELASPDLDASGAFYSSLFGWSVQPVPDSPEPYLVIRNGEASNGGIRPLMPPGTPPNWSVYFGCEDLDASLATLRDLGGSVYAGPIDIAMARIAVVADPQGAVFMLYDGELEP